MARDGQREVSPARDRTAQVKATGIGNHSSRNWRRLVIIARLKPGARATADQLLERGPPFDPGDLGLRSHAVYLSESEVVFVFEAEQVEEVLEGLIENPVVARALDAWRPLVERAPRRGEERYYWSSAVD